MLLCSGPKLLIQGEDQKNLVHVSGECEEQRNINTPFEVDRRYMNSEKKKDHCLCSWEVGKWNVWEVRLGINVGHPVMINNTASLLVNTCGGTSSKGKQQSSSLKASWTGRCVLQ